MDPQAYCARACSELLANRGRPGVGRGAMQRAAVLPYFAGRALSSADFARELEEPRQDAERIGRPALAEAAAGILRDRHARPAA